MNLEGHFRKLIKGATITASLTKQHKMSGQHYRAAAYFAAESARVESAFPPPQTDSELLARHRACVTASIFSAVACLEASINEFYSDCVHLNKSMYALEGLREEHRKKLAQWWTPRRDRSTAILEKYRQALQIADASALDRGTRPYQDVDGLIQLRNQLTHFLPEYDNDPQAKHFKIKKRLRDRFPPSPYSSPHETLWFPHTCLGAGCAMWAVDSAKQFLNQFSEALGIPPRI